MGIIIRQSLKTVIITYTGIIFGFLNTLVLYPLVLKEEQIGLVRILINAAILFSTFAALGTSTMPVLFFPYFKNASKQHHGFLFFLLVVSSIGFVTFLFLFILFKPFIISTYIEREPLIVNYFYYLIPLTFAVLFYNILETYTIIHQLPVFPSFLREVMTRSLLSLGLFFIFLQLFSFSNFVSWVIYSYIVILISIILYLKFNRILYLTPNFSLFKSDYFKPMATYGGFVLLANISGAIVSNIDGLMLSAYSGLKSTGIYTIAFFIAQIVEIPRRSLSQVIIPLVSEANNNHDMDKLKELYRKSSLNQLIVGGTIFLWIWCNIENIFKFIPNGHIYVIGKWVVLYIGLSKLVDMATGVNAEIIGSSKYYKIDLFIYFILTLIGVGLNFLLIPVFGLNGAAYAVLASVCLYNTMRFIFITIVMKIQPFTGKSLIALFCLAITYFIASFVPSIGGAIVDTVFRTILIGVILGGLILGLQVSEDISQTINKIVIRLSSK